METAALILLIAAFGAEAATPSAEGVLGEDYDVFETPVLRWIIGDNAAMGGHAGRYNGVFSVAEKGGDFSPFVESYAGLNLEHYFDGRPRPADSAVFFEPRNAPMTFTRIDANTAELHQPATPVYGVESWSRFEAKSPYYIDLRFRCIPHKEVFQGGFFGVFWASYINGPEDKSIYFLREGAALDAPFWEQLCTQKHGVASSVRQAGEEAATLFQEPGELLYANFSGLNYGERFFYGRVRDKVLIYIFAPGPIVRFAHSPSGGGENARGDGNNPAWDFQMIVPGYRAGQEYRLDMRLAYKPWAGREDVLSEVRKYFAEMAPGGAR